MAKIVQAVNIYGPKLEHKPTAGLEKVSEWAAMRTGLNKSEVLMSLQEFSDAILNFCKDGTPVKLPGVGTFTPDIDREGNINIGFRADMALKKVIKSVDNYQGVIANKNRIAIDNAAYKQLWDADHPDDLLEI